MKTVSPAEVRELTQAQPSAIILDVRTPEQFEVAHLPGARHACVFQVDFLNEVRRLAPDPSAPLVTCGASQASLESTNAALKLERAGYGVVHNFVGGLAAWRAAGLPVEGTAQPRELQTLNGVLPIDLCESRIEWIGRNLLNKHAGTVAIRSGQLSFVEGWMSGGEIVIDMNSIQCTDIAAPDLNALLIDHLKSDDFFDVAQFPEARLMIKQCAPIASGAPGSPNLRMITDLTLRRVTRELVMTAVAGRTPDGRAAAQSVFAFDRTQWGVSYGSGKLFQNLGQHLVNDLIEVQVRLLV